MKVSQNELGLIRQSQTKIQKFCQTKNILGGSFALISPGNHAFWNSPASKGSNFKMSETFNFSLDPCPRAYSFKTRRGSVSGIPNPHEFLDNSKPTDLPFPGQWFGLVGSNSGLFENNFDEHH